MSIAAERLPQADHSMNPGQDWGWFDFVPSFCGGQRANPPPMVKKANFCGAAEATHQLDTE